MQPLARPHRTNRLQRYSDGNPDVGVPTVEEVVAVVDVADVHVVIRVPIVPPILRPWVDQRHPIAVIPEPGSSAHDTERVSVDTEPVLRTEVSTESGVGDAVCLVAAALLPATVFQLPASLPMLLPRAVSLPLPVLLSTVTLWGSVSLLALLILLCKRGSSDPEEQSQHRCARDSDRSHVWHLHDG